MNICAVAACVNRSRARGYCVKHYAKWRKYGSPSARATRDNRCSHAHLRSPLSLIDATLDTRKGQRGYLTPKLVAQVRNDAKKAGHTWTLTDMETYTLLVSPCVYCGFVPEWPTTRCGIDRVDSLNEYHRDNCVSSCATCNAAKGNKTVAAFMEWAKRLYAYNLQDVRAVFVEPRCVVSPFKLDVKTTP